MGDFKDSSSSGLEVHPRKSRMRLPSISTNEELKIVSGSSGSPIVQANLKTEKTDLGKTNEEKIGRTRRSRNLGVAGDRFNNKLGNEGPGEEGKETNKSNTSLGPAAYLSSVMNNLANENASSPASDRLSSSLNQSNSAGSGFRSTHKKKNRNDSSSHHKPAEVFRKDLISAMKIPDTSQLLTEEYWLMRDTWRMEWEKGVQVPVNPNAIPNVKVSLVAKDVRGDFRMPRKMIKATPDAGDRDTVDLNVLADSTCRYDLDEVDVAWLEVINEERQWMGYPPLDEFTMEIIMEELETQCHENMQLAIKTKEGLGIEYDENIVCDVCRSPDCEEGNEMVFCDGCNLCVHQACYGILKVPEGSWLCKPCALGIRGAALCILCGKKGGAMKSTRSGNKWCHVSCALWIPEISIADPERMEPITKVSHIPSSRWSLICNVCKERSVGACIQCSVRHCVTAYHVTCAIENRFDMITDCPSPNAETGNNTDSAIIFRSYCQKHSKNSKKKNEHGPEKTEEEKRSDRQRRIAELEEEFYSLVRVEGVVNTLNIPRETASQVLEFWKLKRKANFNRALITPKQEEAKALAEAAETGLQRRLRMFTHLRQDLERVRNLCYMIGRREKLKRSSVKNMENVFLAQIKYVENRMSYSSQFDPKTLISTLPKFGMPAILSRAKEESLELAKTREWNPKSDSRGSSPAPTFKDEPEAENNLDVLDKRKEKKPTDTRPHPKLSATVSRNLNAELSSEYDTPSPGTPVPIKDRVHENKEDLKRNGLLTPEARSRRKSLEKSPRGVKEQKRGESLDKLRTKSGSTLRRERLKSHEEKGTGVSRSESESKLVNPIVSSNGEAKQTLSGRPNVRNRVNRLSKSERRASRGSVDNEESSKVKGRPLSSPNGNNTVKNDNVTKKRRELGLKSPEPKINSNLKAEIRDKRDSKSKNETRLVSSTHKLPTRTSLRSSVKAEGQDSESSTNEYPLNKKNNIVGPKSRLLKRRRSGSVGRDDDDKPPMPRRSSRHSSRATDNSNSEASANDSSSEASKRKMTIVTETISETKRFDLTSNFHRKRLPPDLPPSSSRKRFKGERKLDDDSAESMPSSPALGNKNNKLASSKKTRLKESHANERYVDSTGSSGDDFSQVRSPVRNLRHRQGRDSPTLPTKRTDNRTPERVPRRVPSRETRDAESVQKSSLRRHPAKNGKRALASPCDSDEDMVCNDLGERDARASPAPKLPGQGLEKQIPASPTSHQHSARHSPPSPIQHKTRKSSSSKHRPSVETDPSKSPSLWDVNPDPAWRAIGLDVSYGSNCPAKLRRRTVSSSKQEKKTMSSGLSWIPLGEDSDQEEQNILSYPKRLGTPKDQEGYRGDMDESDTELLRINSSRQHKHYHHHKSSSKRHSSSSSGKLKTSIGMLSVRQSDSSEEDFDLSITSLRSDSSERSSRQKLRSINNTSPNTNPVSDLPRPPISKQVGNVTKKSPPKTLNEIGSKNVMAVGGTLGVLKFEHDLDTPPFYPPTTDGKRSSSVFPTEFSPENSLKKDIPPLTRHTSANMPFIQPQITAHELLAYPAEQMPFSNAVFAYPPGQPWQGPSIVPSILPNQYPLPVFYQYPPLPQPYHKGVNRTPSLSEPEVRPSPPPMPDSTLSPESLIPTSASVAVQASSVELSQTPVTVLPQAPPPNGQTGIQTPFDTRDPVMKNVPTVGQDDDNEWEVVSVQKREEDEEDTPHHRRKHKKKKKKKKRHRMRFLEGVESGRSEDYGSPGADLQDPTLGTIEPRGQSVNYETSPITTELVSYKRKEIKTPSACENITPILSKMSQCSNTPRNDAVEVKETTEKVEKTRKLVLKIDKRKFKMPEESPERYSTSSRDSSPSSASSSEDVWRDQSPVIAAASPLKIGGSTPGSLKMTIKLSRPLILSEEVKSHKHKHGKKHRHSVFSVGDEAEAPWSDTEKKTVLRTPKAAPLRRLGLDASSIPNSESEEGIGRRALRERKPPPKPQSTTETSRDKSVSSEQKRRCKSQNMQRHKNSVPRNLQSGLPKNNDQEYSPPKLRIRESDSKPPKSIQEGPVLPSGANVIPKRGRGRPKKIRPITVKAEQAPDLGNNQSPTEKDRKKLLYKPKDQARFAGWSTKTSKVSKPVHALTSQTVSPPLNRYSLSTELDRGSTELSISAGPSRSASVDSDHHHSGGSQGFSSPGHQPARHWKKRKVHEHEHEKQLFEHGASETSANEKTLVISPPATSIAAPKELGEMPLSHKQGEKTSNDTAVCDSVNKEREDGKPRTDANNVQKPPDVHILATQPKQSLKTDHSKSQVGKPGHSFKPAKTDKGNHTQHHTPPLRPQTLVPPATSQDLNRKLIRDPFPSPASNFSPTTKSPNKTQPDKAPLLSSRLMTPPSSRSESSPSPLRDKVVPSKTSNPSPISKTVSPTASRKISFSQNKNIEATQRKASPITPTQKFPNPPIWDQPGYPPPGYIGDFTLGFSSGGGGLANFKIPKKIKATPCPESR